VTDPFAVLGLGSGTEVTDDDVRAAWRRIATATHPDRADGGDPDRFARAAAAYTDLRTARLRGEARAALIEAAQAPEAGGLGIRLTGGRPVRLLLRVLLTVAVSVAAVLLAGSGPAGPALVVGAVTWLLVTGRSDLGAG
jgi:hypothetical protein